MLSFEIGICFGRLFIMKKNILVIFGLSVNSNIISYLSGMPINRIIISTNNDDHSEDNRGFIAAIKNYLKCLLFLTILLLEFYN